MKFRCERDVLLEALTTAGRAVSGRSASHPVLTGVKLALTGDQLELTGTDHDLTITALATVSGMADGVAVFPSKLAADIVRALSPGAVTVEIGDDQAQISSGRTEFSIRLIPAAEFPVQGEPPESQVDLAANVLADALRQVVKAASSDDARPILTGVLLEAESDGLRLVATDSYRLAVRDLPETSVLGEGQKVLIPSRALGELTRLLGDEEQVTLRLGEREAVFQVGGVRLTTRLIEGDFPNYRGLIPDEHRNRLIVNREVLLEAVRRVRLLAREATPVRVNMSTDGMSLRAVTQDVGEAVDQIDAEFTGSELEIAFNPEYLIDGAEVATGEELVLHCEDALKPALLTSMGDDRFLYLLMPVRVS